MDSETSASFFADRFGRSHEVIARAPGRIEFIGNHLDYNDGPREQPTSTEMGAGSSPTSVLD
jgi:hypothetical protein